MRSIVASWRLLGVLAHLLAGMWTLWAVFPRLTQTRREDRIQAWALAMLGHLAIDLVVEGVPPAAGPVLLVANHISWLDIIVIHATRHCRFVSKSDVRHWPVVGFLAAGADTLFIERTSARSAMRVVHHMAERLDAGDVLAVFPEGTTGDGSVVLPFHANLLQAAIAVDAPVQPLALQFSDGRGQTSLAPCYIGDDTLVASVWRTLRAPHLQAVVRFGEAQRCGGRDRRAWAADLRSGAA